jgi:ABC-type nitrate/sulfonate/bicarbonate transport system substrate-binding protein
VRVRMLSALLMSFIVSLGGTLRVYAAEPVTVRVMTRALGDSTLIYEIGDRLGFYGEEGIKIQVILAKVSTATQAVLGGSADYVNHGSIITPILRGVPFKILLVDADKPPHYVVTSTKVQGFKDLIGRTIAIDDFAGASALMLRDTLIANGIPLNKVTLRALGPPPLRYQALVGGVVDAAPLNFVLSRRAQQEGFRILAYTGDYTSDIQVTGAVPLKTIRTSPRDVYKFVKATLKAQLFLFENPNDDGFKFYSEMNQLVDSPIARDAYNARLKRSTELVRIGRADEQTLVQAMDRVREQLQLAGTPLKEDTPKTLDGLVDFSFAKRAYEEITADGWDTKKHQYRYVKRSK